MTANELLLLVLRARDVHETFRKPARFDELNVVALETILSRGKVIL